MSHYVAKYDRSTVSKFVEKLYGANAVLDEFHCSDSIPHVVAWLKEDVKKHVEEGRPQKAHVMQLAPLIGDWIVQNSAKNMRARGGRTLSGGNMSTALLAAALAAGVAIGVALARR